MANDAFSDFLVHPKTRNQLEAFINGPSHALMILGQAGSGRYTLAQSLSAILLSSTPQSLPNHPYFMTITKADNKSEIAIDAIRQLINKLSLRVASPQGSKNAGVNRIALIKDAQLLSSEAQNAVLKLLEEPPAKTLIILTTETEDSVLPTIASRTQKIRVIPVSIDQATGYFKTYPSEKVNSAWLLGRGNAGLINALLDSGSDHPLKQAVDKAKIYLSKDTYGRLVYLQPIAKDKTELYIFLEALSKVLSALNSANLTTNSSNTRKLLTSRKKIHQILSYSEQNANSRLAALSLSLDIPL